MPFLRIFPVVKRALKRAGRKKAKEQGDIETAVLFFTRRYAAISFLQNG